MLCLLDLIDHPHLFDCLLLVIENVIRICNVLPDTDLGQPWDSARKKILNVNAVCLNLIADEAKFLWHLPDLGINLHSKSLDMRKSSMQRFTKQAPLWANVGNLPVQKDAFNSYFVLLAQVWLCYILIFEHGKQDLIDGSLRSALGELWKLANEKESVSIKQLPESFCSPFEYSEQLRFLSAERDLPVSGLASYLEDAQDLLLRGPVYTHKPSEDNDSEDLVSEWVRDELYDDYDDELSDPSPTPIMPVTRKTFKALASTQGVQIRKRLARENQLFPFALNMLSERALKNVMCYLSEPDSDLQGKAILALTFWGAMDADRLSLLSTGLSCERHFVGDCYDAQTGVLFLSSPYPFLKHPPAGKQLLQLNKRQEFVELPMPGIVTACLTEYLQSIDRDSGRLFFLSPAEITTKVRQLTRSLRKTTGSYITSGLVRTYLPQRLSRMRGGDPAFSDLTFGIESYLGRTKVYYAAFDHCDLERSYRVLSHSVLLESGQKSTYTEIYPEDRTLHVGTPKRPTLQAVQDAFQKLSELIYSRGPAKSKEEFIRRHNFYVAYTVLLIKYCTGFRAVTHPYIDSQSYDPLTGFCGLGDKDSVEGNRARPLWLPQVLMRHLEFYRSYLRSIVSCRERDVIHAIEGKGLASLFFLSSGVRLSSRIVRPKTLGEQFEAAGYYVPLNSQRHFLKSELQEDGCPPDVIELFLGHFEVGEEGYSPSSSLHPYDYKSEVEKYLTPVLNKIGARPLAGPLLPERGLSISLGRLPKDTSARQKRKSRKKKDISAEKRVLLTQFLQGIIPQKIIDDFKKDQLDVLQRAEKHCPELFLPLKESSLLSGQLQKFYVGLGGQRKKGKVLYKQQRFFRWLAFELTKGFDLPCRLPEPLFLPSEKNLVRAQVGNHLSDFRALESAFVGDLERPLSEDPGHRLGQVLLSGILFGGLLDRKWVEAVPCALRSGVFLVGDLMWLDLWTSTKPPVREYERFLAQMEPDRYRRWLPDPTTKLLVYRWLHDFSENHRESSRSDVSSLLCAYLKYLGFNYGTEQSSFNRLLRIGSAAALIRWPPVVVSYAKGLLSSASLPTERWLKIITGNSIEMPVPYTPELSSFPEKNYLLSRQIKLRKELCQIIKPLKKKHLPAKLVQKGIEEFVSKRGGELCPILQILARWALFLLNDRNYDEHPHHKKTALRNTTVAGYLGRVGDPLIRVFRAKNPNLLDIEELQDIYDGLANYLQKSQRLRAGREDGNAGLRVLQTLNLFHWFLEVRYQMPYEAIAKLLKNIRLTPRVRVRAQLILPVEYRNVLCSFNFQLAHRSRLDTIACCILILAYRTGLRLAEILGLRLQDVCLDSPLEIIVRRHGERELKTSFSKRRIPSYLPILKDELELLQGWFLTRFSEAKAAPHSYLFTVNELSNDMLIDHVLIPQILKHLKEVTGDSGIVLHGCRDSFYSSISLSLLKREDVSPSYPLAFADQLVSLPEAFSQAIKGNTATGRNKLHAVAVLVGHSDVATGMFSYFHLADWLLSYSTCHPTAAPHLTAPALASLMGVSLSQAYNILRTQGFPFTESMRRCTQKNRHLTTETLIAKQDLHKITAGDCAEPIFPIFNTLYNKVKLWHKFHKPGWRLPKNEQSLAQLDRWYAIFCDQHRSTCKKLSRLAKLFLKKMKKMEFECTSYQDARDFIWWLDVFDIDRQNMKAMYCRSRWTDLLAGRPEWENWQEKIPDLSIDISDQLVRRKKGVVRIVINFDLATLFTLISLVYDHDRFNLAGGVASDP